MNSDPNDQELSADLLVQLRDEEISAARLPQRLLHAVEVVPRDLPPAQRAHDFDIILNDGSVVAVEVTQAINGSVSALLKAPSPHLDGVEGAWEALVLPSVNLKRRRVLLAEFVRQLEHREQSKCHLNRHSADETESKLYHSGVRALRRVDGGSGNLFVGLAADVGSYGPNELSELVVEMVGARGKCRKLESAVADERHLFVWIDPSRTAQTVALLYEPLPEVVPTLPGSIDRVWLSGPWQGEPTVSFSSADGWLRH